MLLIRIDVAREQNTFALNQHSTARRADRLHDRLSTLASATNIETVAQVASRLIVECFGAVHAALCLLEADGGLARVASAGERPLLLSKEEQIPIFDGPENVGTL